jgi:hypothetical protein
VERRKIKSPGSQPGLDIASWYAISQKQSSAHSSCTTVTCVASI